jgi:hypothetical protein
MQAEMAAREIGPLGLNDALDYLVLVAAEDPERFERATRNWFACPQVCGVVGTSHREAGASSAFV